MVGREPRGKLRPLCHADLISVPVEYLLVLVDGSMCVDNRMIIKGM